MRVPELGFSGTVGFTGTREGMTDLQGDTVTGLLSLFMTLRHGSCKGADEEAHIGFKIANIKRNKGFIVLHPPKDEKLLFRPKLRGMSPRISSAVPKDYLVRDRDIVDLSDVMVGAPLKKIRKRDWSSAKGGTWYTINYAIAQKKPLVIVWPDGSSKVVDPR